MAKDLRPLQARETTWKTVLEVQKRFETGITMLDPIEHMKIKDEKFKQLVRVRINHFVPWTISDDELKKIDVMEKKMFSSPLHKDPRLPHLYRLFSEKKECENRITDLKKRVQTTLDILQLEELKCRKRVLRRLGFTTSSDIVDMKGRVACEISTGDELLLTELIFDGVFNPLSPEQCAALLSCFVFEEKVRQVLFYERFEY